MKKLVSSLFEFDAFEFATPPTANLRTFEPTEFVEPPSRDLSVFGSTPLRAFEASPEFEEHDENEKTAPSSQNERGGPPSGPAAPPELLGVGAEIEWDGRPTFADASPFGGPGGPNRNPPPDDEPPADEEPPADPSELVTASYVSGPADGYNVEVVFESTQEDQDLYWDDFKAAADFFSTTIVGDVEDITSTSLPNGFVDDVLIEASVVSIDGSGGTLASAGPRAWRTEATSDPYLPVLGAMNFDSADIGDLGAQVFDVIVHEMAHAIGFGTMWDEFDGLVVGKAKGKSADLRFTGPTATEAYADLIASDPAWLADDPNADAGVPIETSGGRGTAGGHWKESIFGPELMTGYVEPSGDMPFSAVSIAALQDMGYETAMFGGLA